ncbi:MAG: copper amine oxidase-like protein [Clostridia bacterium]|jgi:hypothetical protein|nr:copper amine oxidase-like protein [Clostridia bacterium]
MKRRLIAGLLFASLMLGNCNVFAEEVLDNPIQNINEQSYEVNETIDGTEQENVTDKEDVIVENKEVILTLGSNKAQVNGQEYILLSSPKVIGGRTFLPLRFVADQVLGSSVVWNNDTREVTVTREENTVVVKIGEKTAFINGEKVEIDVPPVIANSVTLLPIRFMSEAFGITANYNEQDKTITLIQEAESGSGNSSPKPVAEFSFDKELYIAGQEVQTIDKSYDIDGSQIIEKLWMINNDPKLTTPKLDNIFKTPRQGNYKISLKVRNSKGIWSDWTDQELIIMANEKPVITNIDPDKNAYAQGQDMNFTYTYNNEDWENIKSEKWTYRRMGEAESKAIIDKPRALFAEGDYIITLQIQDTYGNLSDKTEIIIHITDEVLKTELTYRFTEGQIGDTIDNFQRVNYQSYSEVFPYETGTVDGTLIMSDSPEVVKREGVLYKESINGIGRILLHHINNLELPENDLGNRRLVLMAENTTNQPVRIFVNKKTIKGPTEDTLYIGQLLLYDYLKSSAYEEYVLQPGEKKYVYDSVKKKWLKGQCISGLMDVITEGKIDFTVAAVGENATIEAINKMSLLDKDIHPRGTFNTTDIYYSVNLEQNEPQKLIIGKGTAEWANGYDAITGESVQNRGNFGISYHIKLTAKEDMGIILNPRGNIFRGAVKWKDGGTYLTPTKGFFAGDTTKSVVLGTIKAGETRELEYMLPNGSSAPVLIGFIPQSHWSK